jgi:hypothetical protein
MKRVSALFASVFFAAVNALSAAGVEQTTCLHLMMMLQLPCACHVFYMPDGCIWTRLLIAVFAKGG